MSQEPNVSFTAKSGGQELFAALESVDLSEPATTEGPDPIADLPDTSQVEASPTDVVLDVEELLKEHTSPTVIDDDDEPIAVPEYDEQTWHQKFIEVATKEKQLKKSEQHYTQLSQFEQALSDKNSYRDAFNWLATNLSQMHGVSVEELTGVKQSNVPQKEPATIEEDYEMFDDDKKLLAKAVEIAEANMVKKYGLDKVQEELSKREQESKFDKQLDEQFPAIKKKLETAYGLRFSRGQVADAVRKNPSVEPLKAVVLEYQDLIIKEQSKRLMRSAPKGPEALPQSDKTSSPKSNKSGRQYGWDDALTDLGFKS